MGREYMNKKWCAKCKKFGPTPYLKQSFKYFPPAGMVMDVGCGNGRNSKFMKEMGYPVDSIDMAVGRNGWGVLGRDRLPIKNYSIFLINYILMFLSPKERKRVLWDINNIAPKGGVVVIEMYPAKDAYPYDFNDIVDWLYKRGWGKIRKSKDKCVLVKED